MIGLAESKVVKGTNGYTLAPPLHLEEDKIPSALQDPSLCAIWDKQTKEVLLHSAPSYPLEHVAPKTSLFISCPDKLSLNFIQISQRRETSVYHLFCLNTGLHLNT